MKKIRHIEYKISKDLRYKRDLTTRKKQKFEMYRSRRRRRKRKKAVTRGFACGSPKTRLKIRQGAKLNSYLLSRSSKFPLLFQRIFGKVPKNYDRNRATLQIF